MVGKEAIKRLLEIDPGVITKPYKIEKLSQILHKVISGLEGSK